MARLTTLILGALLLAVSVVAPGVLAVRLLDDGDLLHRVAVGLAVGVLAVPALAFLAAIALSVNLRPSLLLGVGLTLDAALAIALAVRSRRA